MRGGGGRFRVSTIEYSCPQGAQINFGDLTPDLTYDTICSVLMSALRTCTYTAWCFFHIVKLWTSRFEMENIILQFIFWIRSGALWTATDIVLFSGLELKNVTTS
jgi:hypothetical protein